MSQNPAIVVEDLVKQFDNTIAVNSLNFTIPENSICGLLGGNGAGKTTTISMLLGLLIPSSGKVTILGENMLVHRYRVLPRINFTSPYVDLPKRLSVIENLLTYARLYNIPNYRDRVDELCEELELNELKKRLYGALSAGQKTRVVLAKALINKPQVLFLDEPTASLDPDTADRIRHYLLDYQRSSKSCLLLASHNMKEVELMCDDVLMMRKGELVDQGSPKALLEKYGQDNMEEVFLDISRERV